MKSINKIKDLLSLMRIKHYIKNFLIFLPLIFSENLFKKELFLNALFSFFIFSLVCSTIYIINDLKDINNDR